MVRTSKTSRNASHAVRFPGKSLLCATVIALTACVTVTAQEVAATTAATNVVERAPLTQGPAKKIDLTTTKVKTHSISSFYMDFTVVPSTGQWMIQEKVSNSKGGQIWTSGEAAFGSLTYQVDDKIFSADLTSCEVANYKDGLMMTFHPVKNIPAMSVMVLVTPSGTQPALHFTIHSSKQLDIASIRLFDGAFPVTSEDADAGVYVPSRAGMFIPANSGKTFERYFGDSVYDGCHVRMWGLTKNGTAAFLTWDDSYTKLGLKSEMDRDGKQILSTSIEQKREPKGFSFYVCGKGGINEIAADYRRYVATKRGYYVPWSKKLAENDSRKSLFGATNYKLWSVLDRQMDEESKNEKSVRVNWTFDEVAEVAKHLKNDLKMDDVLFSMGGWINRGYDNQHPDVLPAAPECGGNVGLTKAVWTVQDQGYTACLHDNYQDMYTDAPSFDEKYLLKRIDGSTVPGGTWAGGRPYLTCSKAAVELAQRPNNLSKVKELTSSRAYFIDTTYAAGLEECYDKSHPQDFDGDIRSRLALSDYARQMFGIFGSEDGREWAIPHADFFEGITSVSLNSYHNMKLDEFGAVMVPIFELIYHDCIAAYGKYGYDINQSAELVLRHIAMGRPMFHHSVPTHLYWQAQKENAPVNADPKAVYVRSNGGWADGRENCMHPFDVYVKNTHEILSPLNKITAEMQMVRFAFVSPDKQVTMSVFQGNGKTVVAIVNYGENPYHAVGISGDEYEIPQYGFLIESESFVAFNATLYNGVKYEEPVLFTLTSLDGKSVWKSEQVKVYHGFGPDNLKIGFFDGAVPQEAIIKTSNNK